MELQLLSAQLQDCYNAATVSDLDDHKVYCPIIGHAYIACADDNLWYRAQTLGEEFMYLHYIGVVNTLIVVSSCYVTLAQYMES